MSELNRTQVSHKVALGWVMCIIAACYYCYAYVLRMYPSVMVQDLRHYFDISATAFGTLTAFYYYAYTPMQLAVGIIIDRLGARLILTGAALLGTLGMLMFITAHSIGMAYFARFVMGFGAAFAYVTVLKLATVWLPPNRFAMMAGLTTSLGMIAATTSDVLLSRIVQAVGYKHVLNILLVAGAVLTVVVAVFVRNRPKNAEGKREKAPEHRVTFMELLKGLGYMFAMPQMWIVGILGLLLYLPASVFLDTWGIPYLEHVHHLAANQATTVISMVFIGWIISSPILGAISDKIRLRKLPLMLCAFAAGIVSLFAFYLPHPGMMTLYILFFLFGIFAGVHPLVFSIARENNPNKLAGTSIALTNAFIMVGGFVQPVVGLLLDWHWSGGMSHGIRTYSATDFKFALVVIPAALILSGLIAIFVRETHCKLPQD